MHDNRCAIPEIYMEFSVCLSAQGGRAVHTRWLSLTLLHTIQQISNRYTKYQPLMRTNFEVGGPETTRVAHYDCY